MFIQNVSLANIRRGRHLDAGTNGMLIQIVDPEMEFPVPLRDFAEIHRFRFDDIECEDPTAITDSQAAELANLLQYALANKINVIVHCYAGLCRSGAIAEVGIMLGFKDTKAFRCPNLRVKHKMLQALGMNYDKDEKPSTNGVPVSTQWNDLVEKGFIIASAAQEHREREGDI